MVRSRRGHGEVTERSRRVSESSRGPSIELTTTHPALGLSEAPSGPVLANSTSLPSPPLSPRRRAPAAASAVTSDDDAEADVDDADVLDDGDWR